MARKQPTKRESSAYVLKVPPSPSLSACKTMNTYLSVTIMKSDQMTRDRAPRRFSFEGASEKVDE